MKGESSFGVFFINMIVLSLVIRPIILGVEVKADALSTDASRTTEVARSEVTHADRYVRLAGVGAARFGDDIDEDRYSAELDARI